MPHDVAFHLGLYYLPKSFLFIYFILVGGGESGAGGGGVLVYKRLNTHIR